jgi:hypothetical protein
MRRRLKRRGFLLIAALLMSIIFLVTGLGVLSAQASRYAASARIAEGMQAKNAALSGLEDVRVKLAKDVHFPPRKSKSRGQTKFAYSETLFEDAADPTRQVTYSVVVDFGLERQCQVPNEDPDLVQWLPFRWGLYRITVSGYVGPRAEPIAQSMFYAEYDIGTGQFIRFEDRGSL